MDPKENLPERVEDGGPNISIDDPAGPHDEQSKANTHQGASVCRMLVRCSTDSRIKRPHRSSLVLASFGYHGTIDFGKYAIVTKRCVEF